MQKKRWPGKRHQKHLLRGACSQNTDNSSLPKNLLGLRHAYVDIMRNIGGWFLIGVLIADVISFAVPDRFFESLSGNNRMAMLRTLIIYLSDQSLLSPDGAIRGADIRR